MPNLLGSIWRPNRTESFRHGEKECIRITSKFVGLICILRRLATRSAYLIDHIDVLGHQTMLRPHRQHVLISPHIARPKEP